jgi:hypothetical protein
MRRRLALMVFVAYDPKQTCSEADSVRPDREMKSRIVYRFPKKAACGSPLHIAR